MEGNNRVELISEFIEVILKNPEDFNKIRETLTRIGIVSKTSKTLYQSAHILHKKGRYYIVHFKEMLLLDGRDVDYTENDIARRNTIANLLEEWELLELLDPAYSEEPVVQMNQIKIIPFAEKHEWRLVSKYSVGNKNYAKPSKETL